MNVRGQLPGALGALQSFAQEREQVERCELCSAAVGPRHDHLVSPKTRTLRCACAPCALLFDREQGEWRRAPELVKKLDLLLNDGDWESLHLPIALAFFVRSSVDGPLAIFPSPAGPTESPIAPDLWALLAERNPALAALAEDTEALLVNRVGTQRAYFRTSVADGYALIGVIRQHWRGMGGGAQVWKHVADFFGELEARCRS